MAMACTEDFRQEMKRIIAGKKSKFDMDFKGTQKSFDLWPKHLRYCHVCAREDIVKYGEPYWHRLHQLQEMVYCTKHLIRLTNSCIPMRKTTTSFHAASNEIILDNTNDYAYDELACHKEKFLTVARESEWLLNHGMAVDWNFDFHAKYKQLLRELDIVTIQGVSDYDLIVDRFNEYWGESFLKTLSSTMLDNRDWIRQLYAAQIKTFKPIYHILLMCFLRNSVKAFLESDSSDNPFGEEPWPCENPICTHHHADGCRNTKIRYVNGVATGFFQCDGCGMIYKRLKRKGKTGDIIIVDYGHLWKERMLHCLGTKKMTITETAEVLRCDSHTVSWQKKALGLTKKRCTAKERLDMMWRLALRAITKRKYWKYVASLKK
jgi:hypothetical protein